MSRFAPAATCSIVEMPLLPAVDPFIKLHLFQKILNLSIYYERGYEALFQMRKAVS